MDQLPDYHDEIINAQVFGNALRNLREYAGMKPAQLAAAISRMDFQKLGYWKYGIRDKIAPSAYEARIKNMEQGILLPPLPEGITGAEAETMRQNARTHFSKYAFLYFEACRMELERLRYPQVYASLGELIEDRGSRIKNGHAMYLEAEQARPKPAARPAAAKGEVVLSGSQSFDSTRRVMGVHLKHFYARSITPNLCLMAIAGEYRKKHFSSEKEAEAALREKGIDAPAHVLKRIEQLESLKDPYKDVLLPILRAYGYTQHEIELYQMGREILEKMPAFSENKDERHGGSRKP